MEKKSIIKDWHILTAVLIFVVSALATQWFSDNYSFDGFNIVKNTDDDTSD